MKNVGEPEKKSMKWDEMVDYEESWREKNGRFRKSWEKKVYFGKVGEKKSLFWKSWRKKKVYFGKVGEKKVYFGTFLELEKKSLFCLQNSLFFPTFSFAKLTWRYFSEKWSHEIFFAVMSYDLTCELTKPILGRQQSPSADFSKPKIAFFSLQNGQNQNSLFFFSNCHMFCEQKLIKSVLKRHSKDIVQTVKPIEMDKLFIDRDRHLVTWDGENIELTVINLLLISSFATTEMDLLN